jgi:cytochrome c2
MKSLSFAAVAAVALLTSLNAAQAQSVEAGEDVFKKCRACHQVGPDAANKVGPLLNGIVGRKSGTVEGFAYSDANKAAGEKGLVWTEEEMFKYLADPRAYMPGNKMAFAGLKDEQDRKDVIAYLKTFK